MQDEYITAFRFEFVEDLHGQESDNISIDEFIAAQEIALTCLLGDKAAFKKPKKIRKIMQRSLKNDNAEYKKTDGLKQYSLGDLFDHWPQAAAELKND